MEQEHFLLEQRTCFWGVGRELEIKKNIETSNLNRTRYVFHYVASSKIQTIFCRHFMFWTYAVKFFKLFLL